MASGEDADQRFAELLHPIRDLTKNWEVDVAKYLEDYIEYLNQFEFTFDGGATRMNFAEAALLIQGSAVVYGKKVDFLWNLVLQMMEMLQGRKDNKANDGGGDNDVSAAGNKKGKRTPWGDLDSWESLDDVPIGKNIRLREDDLANLEDNNLLPVTMPKELLALRPLQDYGDQFRIKIKTAKGEVVGYLDDFKLYQPINFETGMIGDSKPYTDLLSEDLMESEHGQDGFKDITRSSVFAATDPVHAPPEVGQDNDLVGTPDMERVSDMEEPTVIDNDHDNRQRPALRELRPSDLPGFEDPFAPLDPHEPVGVPKPCRKGKTVRLPSEVEQEVAPEAGKKRLRNVPVPLVPIDQYLKQAFVHKAYKQAKSFRKPLPEFQAEIALCCEKLKAVKSRLAKVKPVNLNRVHDAESEDEAEPDHDAEDHYAQEVAPEWQDDGNREMEAIFQNEVELGQNLGNQDGVLSYEQLVRSAVAEYMASAQNALQSTDSAKRVAEWHDRMRPILEDEEDRRSFDIHAYGGKILEHFAPGQETVPFAELVKGKPRYEISRYFLSSLQLANYGNVDLSLTNPEPLSMDCLQLTFLSNKRQHEDLNEFGRESIPH